MTQSATKPVYGVLAGYHTVACASYNNGYGWALLTMIVFPILYWPLSISITVLALPMIWMLASQLTRRLGLVLALFTCVIVIAPFVAADMAVIGQVSGKCSIGF